MKHPDDLIKLFDFMSNQNLDLSDRQKHQFAEYLQLLEKWSGKQNLVSRNDIPFLVERHFLPSILFCNIIPAGSAGPLIDLGSGAGFPGVIIKILSPAMDITLIDSSKKKALFLNEVCEALDLDARVLCERVEEFGVNRQNYYAFVVARAVASLKMLVEWTWGIMAPGGRMITIKGPDYKQEIDELNDIKPRYAVQSPDQTWLNYSDYLRNKFLIIMEK